MPRFRTALLILLLASAASVQARRPNAVTGQFDYYAVALSWSPSYCADHRDPDQCSSGRQLGFVLHGLWPQYETGYPQECSNESLPSQVRGQYATLFPSPKMINHEWRKHGTCSGLDPAAYFALSSKLREQLRIPPAFQKPAAPVRVTYGEFGAAFRAANTGIAPDSVLPFCGSGGRFLRELHACYTRDGRSRSCSAGEIKRSQNSCRQESFILQSVR
jgi:ribonuclease T2